MVPKLILEPVMSFFFLPLTLYNLLIMLLVSKHKNSEMDIFPLQVNFPHQALHSVLNLNCQYSGPPFLMVFTTVDQLVNSFCYIDRNEKQ
jgi:hypothetical protein